MHELSKIFHYHNQIEHNGTVNVNIVVLKHLMHKLTFMSKDVVNALGIKVENLDLRDIFSLQTHAEQNRSLGI